MKVVDKISNLDVTVVAPPAKAHTLRALAISSLAEDESVICNPLLGEDQLNLIECLRRLGVNIGLDGDRVIVQGTAGKLRPVGERLDVGESGVSMNFLVSMACLADKPVEISGAKRITERPILEIVNGLRKLGCRIEYLGEEGFPPVRVHPGFPGGRTELKGENTSQYFSSISIVSPYAENNVVISCLDEMSEKPYFDISLQMMKEFGVEAVNENYKEITVPNGQRYSGRKIHIEGDYSSASFFFLAGAICKSKITVAGLNADTKQGDRAFVELMEKMGCSVSFTESGICLQGGELRSIEQDMSNLPDLVPPLAIAAAFAKGESRFTNIGHLRNKECDRLAAMVSELGKMGVSAYCDDDSLTVEGGTPIHGAHICTYNDHRIAMSFAVAGLATGEQEIENEMCVAKSFPDFWERFEIFLK